jgi:ribonuclease T1
MLQRFAGWFLAAFLGGLIGIALAHPEAALSGAQEMRAPTAISVTALPPEARTTLQRIETNGPFPYRRDGATFGNRERLLPARPRGYYREYTVATPGERDRGPRRIIAGAAGERYYTADHYRSFRRIVP